MTVIADRRNESPGPLQDPGTDRVHRSTEALFYLGLVAAALLLIFGTLALIAVLPIVVPGYTSASITSGSMAPSLRTGDVVIAGAVEAGDLEEGAIVTYVDPRSGDQVTHRIVDIRVDGSLITKGDMNTANDPVLVPKENIRGQARWIVPFIGWPRVWAATSQWLLLGFAVALLAATVWLSRYGFDARHDPWAAKPRRGTP